MPEQKSHFQEGMYFKEQHEYFLDLFSLEKDAFSVGGSGKNVFEEGTIKEFRLKAAVFLVGLFFFKFLFDIRLPGWLEIGAIIIMCFLFIEGVIRAVSLFNEQARKTAFHGIFLCILALSAIIMVIGYVA